VCPTCTHPLHQIPRCQHRRAVPWCRQLAEPQQSLERLLTHVGTVDCVGTAQHIPQHSTAQHSTAQHSTAQHSTAQHSTAQHSTTFHSSAQGDS